MRYVLSKIEISLFIYLLINITHFPFGKKERREGGREGRREGDVEVISIKPSPKQNHVPSPVN